MWRWLEKYFTFTSGERSGILLLLFLSISVFILPKVYLYLRPVEKDNSSEYQKEIDAFVAEYNEKKLLAKGDDSATDNNTVFNPYAAVDLSSRYKKKEERKIIYFDFDPNKIGMDEWMKLGFSEKQAESIEKLKGKGYKFYKPEDLKSVFVVGEENYSRLSPYIKIDPNDFPRKEYPKTTYPERTKEKFLVDINVADSSLFEQQRGIGPSLASRIIKYRERLGGFVSPEQISEIWNFPDSTYQSLKERFVVNEVTLRKLDLNTADFETMRKHPYINYSFAKVIMAYKKEHGNFKSPDDLKKVPIMTDSIFRKLLPYISIQ